MNIGTNTSQYIDKDTSNVVEKRSELRFNKKLVMVGIVTNCPSDQTLHGAPIRCETVDISGHGMKIKSDIEIPTDTLLNISVAYSLEKIYHITARVRWCNIVEDEPLMGIRLIEDKDSDIDQWIKLISENH